MHESFLDPAGIVDPTDDGSAWSKACTGCALKRTDPQSLGEEVQKDLRDETRSGWLEFYCVHRRDETGKHRICASADAIRRGATRHR